MQSFGLEASTEVRECSSSQGQNDTSSTNMVGAVWPSDETTRPIRLKYIKTC